MEREARHKFMPELTPPFWQGETMYYVYLLQSQRNKSIYVGTTNELERRLNTIEVKTILPGIMLR